jgi:hypothetical protein
MIPAPSSKLPYYLISERGVNLTAQLAAVRDAHGLGQLSRRIAQNELRYANAETAY